MKGTVYSILKELSCFAKSVTVIGSRFHLRGQCFNFQSISFIFFQFLKALKRGRVLSLSKQMVTIVLVYFMGLKIGEGTRANMFYHKIS